MMALTKEEVRHKDASKAWSKILVYPGHPNAQVVQEGGARAMSGRWYSARIRTRRGSGLCAVSPTAKRSQSQLALWRN